MNGQASEYDLSIKELMKYFQYLVLYASLLMTQIQQGVLDTCTSSEQTSYIFLYNQKAEQKWVKNSILMYLFMYEKKILLTTLIF